MFQLRKILTNHRLLKPFYKTVIYSPYSLVKPKFEFSDKEFWDYRYSEELQLSPDKGASEDPYEFKKELDDDWEMRCEDWYMSFIEFAHVLIRLMPDTEGKILNVGSGVSEMPFYLHDLGYQYIVNVDYSEKAIEHLENEVEERGIEMMCFTADARNMELFQDARFDYIIDKGTFDTIICSGDEDIFDYLMEIDRLLTKKGTFFLISHSDRVDFFRFFNWKIRLVKIPIPHTEESKELIQEKIDGILEEYKMHRKEKMDYERFKLKEKRIENQPIKFPEIQSPLIGKINELEEKLEKYFDDYSNKIITLEEFKKLDNLLRYGDRNFDRLNSSSDEDLNEEQDEEKIEPNNTEFQMTDLELENCNPNKQTNTNYIANLRYLLYQEAENQIFNDYEVEEKDYDFKDQEEAEIKEDEQLNEDDYKEIDEVFTDTDSERESGEEEEKETEVKEGEEEESEEEEEKVRFLEGNGEKVQTGNDIDESIEKDDDDEEEEMNNPKIIIKVNQSNENEKEIKSKENISKINQIEKDETYNFEIGIEEIEQEVKKREIEDEKELKENVKRYSELISDLSSDEEASLKFEEYLDDKLEEDLYDEEEEANERIKNMKVDEYYYFYSIKKL